MDKIILPLFPLVRVLFPKMILPLHIFEERYKAMISQCIARESLFGVLSEDNLHRGAIGSAASIYRVLKKYTDGRYDLLAVGIRRLRLLRLIDDKLYPRGEVEFITDQAGIHSPEEQIQEMLTLYRSFIARLGLLQKQRDELVNIVEELEQEQEISYIIGQTIGLNQIQQRDLLAETNPIVRVGLLTTELKRHHQIHVVARNLYEKSDYDPTLN